MKKMALAVVAIAMMVIGLSAAPSQAGPYTGTVATKVGISQNPTAIKAGQRPNIHGFVVPASGQAAVRGVFQMVCWRTKPNGQKVGRLGPRQSYTGGQVKVAAPKLNAKGVWRCYVKFDGGNTVYKASVAKPRQVRVR